MNRLLTTLTVRFRPAPAAGRLQLAPRAGGQFSVVRRKLGKPVLRWEPNARQETFWAVRMGSSEEIESLKAKVREGMLPVRQRATMNRCIGVDGKTEVLVVAVLLGLGPDPVDPASVYVGLIDEHHPILGHRLEALTTQDTVGVVFIGDSHRIECRKAVSTSAVPRFSGHPRIADNVAGQARTIKRGGVTAAIEGSDWAAHSSS